MQAWHLSCPHCRKSTRADLLELVSQLRRLGMLLREAQPEPEFVESLAIESTHRMVCGACGETGLVKTDAPDDFDGPEAKHCLACGERIPPERLELFPDSQRCAACESAVERGEPVGNDREFCDWCGDLMRMRQRHGRVARYEMVCRGCGAVS